METITETIHTEVVLAVVNSSMFCLQVAPNMNSDLSVFLT